MLNIIIGLKDGVIWNTSEYFNHIYENEWINDKLAVKMIEDIDKSKVLGDKLIDSPFLGLISPEKLSGGVKTLMLIKNIKNKIFNGNQMGYNCLKWLLEICKEEDRFVWFGYLPEFNKYNNYKPTDEWFKVKIINDKCEEIIAKSQRDVTNFCVGNITWSNEDTSELEKQYREIEEELERNMEIKYKNLIIEKMKTLDPESDDYKIMMWSLEE